MQKNLPKKVIEIVKKLKECLENRGIDVKAIYVFGSYAKGEQLKTSDIDLIIVSNFWKNISFLKRLDIINEIIWTEDLGNVEAIPVTSEELEKKESVVLRDASKYWIRAI